VKKEISDIELVEQMVEVRREELGLERAASNSHFSALPPVVRMAEEAIKSPELWEELVAKAKRRDKQAGAALCYGAVRLLDEQQPLPEPLRIYIQQALLKKCDPGRKHKYKRPCRDTLILAALTQLKTERGVLPTRNDATRYKTGKESGSTIIAEVLQSEGDDIAERGIEDIWSKRKKWGY
jgi:hypothetical protein